MIDVCMPIYKSVDVETFVSVFTCQWPPTKLNLIVEHSITGDIASSRNEIVKRILASDSQYSLWIDSDVQFESDALARLIGVMGSYSDAGVVTGLTRGRTYPHDIVCMYEDGGSYRGRFSNMKGSEIPRDVISIDACGADFMLVRNEVFRKYGCDFTRREGITEDLSFCERVREAGWKLYAHGSVRVKHKAEVMLEV